MERVIDSSFNALGLDPTPVKQTYFLCQLPFRAHPLGPEGETLKYEKSLLERTGGLIMAIPETIVGGVAYLSATVIKLGAERAPSLLNPDFFVPALTILAIGLITWAFYPVKATLTTYHTVQTVKAVPYTLLVLYTGGFGMRSWGRLSGPALETFHSR